MYYKTADKSKEKILTVRVNTDFIEKIDKLAKKLGMTRSKLIKRAIEKALEEFKRESADEITRATALMIEGKSMKPSSEEWKKIEFKLESPEHTHKTLKEAMKFIRGREWEES